MVNVERQGGDSVKLSNDDRKYLTVSRSDGLWEIRQYFTGVIATGDFMGSYESADAAIASAKAYLESGKDELDAALRKSGL